MENTYKIFEMVEKMSKDTPTVYDCDGCKYNNGKFRVEHCKGCRLQDGSNWIYRQRPTKFEPFETTFTTHTVGGEKIQNGQ